VLPVLEHERQHALQHEEELLLPLVAVDAATLAGGEPDQVDAERGQAELAPQRLEPLALRLEAPERDARAHVGHGRRR
jgi:hypothetical protein